jgi:hypothetical protein
LRMARLDQEKKQRESQIGAEAIPLSWNNLKDSVN